MPAEKTRADAIRKYLTGAGSDGGAQTDPDASLGNFRSSTLADIMSVSRATPIANIDIDFASGANGEGAGALAAAGVDSLNWTPPSPGTVGPDVTITSGQTMIIEGANDPASFVRATRTSGVDLTGSEADTLADNFNNVIGFDDISTAEASAGDTEYRCACIKNESGTDVKNIKVWLKTVGTQRVSDTTQLGASGAGTLATTGNFNDWPDAGYCVIKDSGGTEREVIYYASRTATVLTVPAAGRGMMGTSAAAGAATDTLDAIPPIAVGKEAPTSQPSGSFTDKTVAGEGSKPAGVTFLHPITQADAVSIGTLAATNIFAIWIERHVAASSTSLASVLNVFNLSFDAA